MPETTTTPARWYAKTSRAKMPGSCWGAGHYYRIALVLSYGLPAMISPRARGVEKCEIIADPIRIGQTSRSAGYRIWQEAKQTAKDRNAALGLPTD